MQLTALDWAIVAISILVSFAPAVWLARRAGSSTAEFFTSGRAAPWWLVGTSMVATTFSTDTPNLVTNLVREGGVAANWAWWAFLLTGMTTVFFYSQLWRRIGVLTDLEFYELRYSGAPARWVRGFRAVYLGLFFNIVIMASVNLAAAKIANVLLGWPMTQTLLICSGINVLFAATSGLWGVLVTDFVQFGIAMGGSVAAAIYALRRPEVGGLDGLMRQIDVSTLRMMPDLTNWEVAAPIFFVPLAVQWWSTWYPGSEPGGGSYIAQRMLAAKSERDAMAGTLLFNAAHYALRPWPWILVALSSMLVFPQVSDIARALPHVDASLLGHDMAYPAMLTFLPSGLLGRCRCRPAGGVRLDHLDASQLGHVVSRERSLSPLHPSGCRRTALRDGRPAGHGAADAPRGALHADSGHRANELRSAPFRGRRHRPAVSPALVLVADQRVERDRGDGELVPAGDGAARGAAERRRDRLDAVAHRDGARDHARVARGDVADGADRSRDARAVLHGRKAGRARLGGGAARGGRPGPV